MDVLKQQLKTLTEKREQLKSDCPLVAHAAEATDTSSKGATDVLLQWPTLIVADRTKGTITQTIPVGRSKRLTPLNTWPTIIAAASGRKLQILMDTESGHMLVNLSVVGMLSCEKLNTRRTSRNMQDVTGLPFRILRMVWLEIAVGDAKVSR